MATLEGEIAVNPSAQTGPDGSLLLPVLSGENTACTAGTNGTTSTPRVSIDNRTSVARRSVR